MNFDWKNWCRFCGNAENNVKHEITIDIQYYFKISDKFPPKVCQSCSYSLNEFQDFISKTDTANKLFQELCDEEDLNNCKINEIRGKFGFEILEAFEESENERIDSLLQIDIKEDFTGSLDSEFSDEDRKSRKHKSRNIKKEINYEDLSNDASYEPEEKRKTRNSSSKKRHKLAGSRKSKNSVDEGVLQVLPTICHICSKIEKSMFFLEKHTQSVHDCSPQIPCLCGQILDNRTTYLRHKKKCFGPLSAPFRCDLCKNRYSSKRMIEKHMIAKHKTAQTSYICKTCGKTFKQQRSLQSHEFTHLPDEIRKVHECPYCDRKFATKGLVKTHIDGVHDFREKTFTCHLCAKRTNGQLKEHFQSHNETCDFCCDICSKKFKTLQVLKRHQINHQPKRYFCNVCNLGFHRGYSRNQHMLSHSEERRFKCTESNCSATFKRKKDVKVHVNGVHLGKKSHLCRICGKDFYYTKDKREHMKMDHPLEFAEYEERYRAIN